MTLSPMSLQSRRHCTCMCRTVSCVSQVSELRPERVHYGPRELSSAENFLALRFKAYDRTSKMRTTGPGSNPEFPIN